ncbi:chromatin modification-related protein EAF1 B isoform X2 [Daucus carota subsp. sativus]|uniref:chromatin modification-related protein EAF1 B isoform X2 n=1 Tax=Daucus carota subsp. sativus TaxID=79200 RepID=UPI0007EFC295|nr:PREDICTED: chromatin modification-related protein EAF1 B-like [Daucus carota subsp. sativus]
MHECSPELPVSVNACIDSMGVVVNHKGGVSNDLSSNQTDIEETKVELSQHYVCYEQARRQLEFLEQGGDPLDFRTGTENAASLSVQSTSLTDQHPEQFVISETKGSFALAASPPGDSDESSGRPRAPSVNDPNSADNLMLFIKENGIPKGERSLLRSSRGTVGPFEQSSQLVGGQHAKESDESTAFGLPKKAYERRNRSRPNRVVVRSNSTDVMSSSSARTALSSLHVPKVVKGTVDADNQKDHMISSNSNMNPTSPNCIIIPKEEPYKLQIDMELDGGNAAESTVAQPNVGLTNAQIDRSASENMQDSRHNQIMEFEFQRTQNETVLSKPESQAGSEQISVGQECDPSLNIANNEVQDTCSLINRFGGSIGDGKDPLNEIGNKNGVLEAKGSDLETSGSKAGLQVNGIVDNEILTNLKSIGSNGCTKEDALESGEPTNMESTKSAEDNNVTKVDNICDAANVNNSSCHSQEIGSLLRDEEALNEKVSNSESKAKNLMVIEGNEQVETSFLENERMPGNVIDSNHLNGNKDTHTGRLHCSIDTCVPETPDAMFPPRDSSISLEQQTCSQDLKLETKAREDSILEEARVIEAKRKRIAELSVYTLCVESRRKSHWDFVLEEMAWLANDFAQERLWKTSAAAQIGCQAASAARLKFEEQKQVTRRLAKAVMDFWCLVEEMSKEQEMSKEREFQKPGNDFGHAVQGYALRFLQYNSSTVQYVQAEVAATPIISNLGVVDMSWKDHLTEENLFYSVPAGAMQIYKKSIESYLLQLEKTGICMQEEVETSGYDAVADYDSRENALEEDEGDANTFYLPGAFVNSRPSKLEQKKKRHLIKGFAAKSYDMVSDSPFMQSNENKSGNHRSVLTGKRTSDADNGSIPTKRMRTASRQRVLSPFNAGAHGCLQAPSKTDASSGDTNSFQDDQNVLHGGSVVLNNMEVESVRNFDRQPQFDSEVSHRPKKKKKTKNLGSTYEHNWRSNSNFQDEQRDSYKRRSESHQFESNGTNGLYGHHIGKKPKLIKQSLDNSIDNVAPVNCSLSSPVASQMSNMPNPNKFIKMLGGRDRGRKMKGLKTASGQTGPGTSWSLFEDQALVVLVHDMGPNWDLVSDAFNSTLKFKCIFRNPKECKERHKVVMDSPGGEGADSADDSGSSRPYRSTLPGIPKGSARQLFQRLQGPMEEDTIKSHLEKITAIGKKQHHRRAQDPKHLQQPHNSHTYALSQVCPNNLDGGPVLTPLDLCDATASSPDVLSLGYQSPNASMLPNSNQGNVAPMLPASGVTSTSAVPGSNFSSASSQINASVRDGRPGIAKSVSISTDEQQRLQQYSQMISGRNFQQSNMPVSGVHPGTDRGVRMLSSGNGVGSPNGLNRSMQMQRPGLQGVASSNMVGPGSMHPSGMMAVPNPVNIHSSPGAGQGNSMMRPHDPMHMMRPTQNVEHQRQMMIPELQMQVSQGNSQGITPYGGLNSSFSNQSAAPSVPSYPLHHQQLHPMSTQHSHVLTNSHHPHLRGPNLASNAQQQALAIRIAKERHIQQQRLLQQHQQQQFAASNSLMPPVPAQPQLAVSSPQNSSQSQTSSPQVSLPPLTTSSSMSPISQIQQKHHIPPHSVARNPRVGGSGSTNQVGKQRQRHSQQLQLQQSGRQHPQQRHQSQVQHQSHSHNQKQLSSHISHQPQPQQVLYSGQTTSSKQHQQTRSHSENSNQNRVLPVAGLTSTSGQAVPPNQQQRQQSQALPKLVNQPQLAVQRLVQPNRQVTSDQSNRVQARETHTSLHPTNSSSQAVSSAAAPSCVDVANVMSADFSASTPQLKALDQVSDSSMSNPATPIDSAGTPPLTIESLPPVRPGTDHIYSSNSLPCVGPGGAVQWLEEPVQLESLTPPPPLEQQQEHLKPQQQQEDSKQSQEQSLLLQEVGNSTSPPEQ